MQGSHDKILRHASKRRMSHGVRGVCDLFSENSTATKTILRDVDYIHWWIGGHWNARLLESCYALHTMGLLQTGAEAVILFDLRTGIDLVSWAQLQRSAKWHHAVEFDECQACEARYPHLVGSKDKYLTCARGIGTFLVAGFTIADLAPALEATKYGSEWDQASMTPPNNLKSSCGKGTGARARATRF